MNVGELYTSPWGEYVVTRTSPVVLCRHGVSYIENPSAEVIAALVLRGVADSPVAVDPRNETGTGGGPYVPLDGGGAPSKGRAELLVGVRADETLSEQLAIGDCKHELTLGAYRSTMSMAWAPGMDVEVWVPCKTRSLVSDQHGNHTTKTHVYFRSSLNGSVFCPECRALRPRTLHIRDGVVIHDSHHDVVSAPCLWFRHEAETPALEFASAGLSAPDASALASGVVDAGSSASTLLAMTVARDEGVPPAPSDAKLVSPPETGPSPCLSSEQSCAASGDLKVMESPDSPGRAVLPADDPKQTVADFHRTPRPIDRPWRGLWEWKEWCAERAAIIEYEGGMTRKIAEQMTRTLAGPAPRAA